MDHELRGTNTRYSTSSNKWTRASTSASKFRTLYLSTQVSGLNSQSLQLPLSSKLGFAGHSTIYNPSLPSLRSAPDCPGHVNDLQGWWGCAPLDTLVSLVRKKSRCQSWRHIIICGSVRPLAPNGDTAASNCGDCAASRASLPCKPELL